MILRDLRKQLGEHRTQQTGQLIYQTAVLAYLQDTHPQGQRTRQTQRHLEGRVGHLERGVHHLGQGFIVLQEHQLDDADYDAYRKQRYPDIIQCHLFYLQFNYLQFYN